MAKSKPPSKHSRAARRATSPSINTDKSLKAVSLPTSSSTTTHESTGADSHNTSSTNKNRPSVLAVHRAAGVSKKTSKPARKSRMTAKMRRRHERGLEMAEAVTERTGLKIEKSIGRARAVQARSKGWDDINARAGDEAGGHAPRRGGMREGGDKGWETDEDMGGDVPIPAGMQSSIFAPAPKKEEAVQSGQAAGGDDEEIL
ncbi:hypothetical protein ACCO45_007481 [Purpureocillium lilacinum]|uniref:Uncharacterized protein n=1 Tax=Purpureocillium lilacinum TaxID=33203 RepID=A0ACC4DTV4_PURLI